jgi:hypothetical protein
MRREREKPQQIGFSPKRFTSSKRNSQLTSKAIKCHYYKQFGDRKEMANYKEKLDELRRNAHEKVKEFDEKFGITEKLSDGARLAQDAAKSGAEALKEGTEKLFVEAEKLRVEAEKIAADAEVSESARTAAREAARQAKSVAENLRETAERVGSQAVEFAKENLNLSPERAGDFFNTARENVANAARKTADWFNFGVGWTRIFNNAVSGISKAAQWTNENPLKAAGTGFSLLLGLRLGSGLPLLGTHWFFNSAAPIWGLKKASEQFEKYLTKREELIKNGDLPQAEAERIKFERDVAKYVGAPLLGAFSYAAGAAMWTQIFNPRGITGAPISWLLGGNPILDGVWLFGNGIICFKIGYDFFMIALEDQAEVQKIVKEIKGLLPTTQEA